MRRECAYWSLEFELQRRLGHFEDQTGGHWEFNVHVRDSRKQLV